VELAILIALASLYISLDEATTLELANKVELTGNEELANKVELTGNEVLEANPHEASLSSTPTQIPPRLA